MHCPAASPGPQRSRTCPRSRHRGCSGLGRSQTAPRARFHSAPRSPRDASGTLRKVAPGTSCTARGGAVPAAGPRDAPARPGPGRCPRGDRREGEGGSRVRTSPASSEPGGSLPQFPARRQSWGELQGVQRPAVPASGPWAGGGPGRRDAGSREGILRVGGRRGDGLEQRAADKAETPPRGAGQWNEWAINSSQWAARVAPLKSRGSADLRLFACDARGAVDASSSPLPARRPPPPPCPSPTATTR